MKILPISAIAMMAVAATGCSDNPTAIHQDDEPEELTFDVTLSSDHLETLSEIEVSFQAIDHSGSPHMDFTAVSLEFLPHGETEWTEVEMHPEGDQFEAHYTFNSSGEYDLRVRTMSHEQNSMETVYEHGDHLEVDRAHMEMGDIRIEFEVFPGDVHEGQEARAVFWMMEGMADASGQHHPIAEMSAEILFTEFSGHSEEHEAHEEEPGLYEAHHTFQSAGEASFEIHFTDGHGNDQHSEFHMTISESH